MLPMVWDHGSDALILDPGRLSAADQRWPAVEQDDSGRFRTIRTGRTSRTSRKGVAVEEMEEMGWQVIKQSGSSAGSVPPLKVR